jgi:hypothetical protein
MQHHSEIVSSQRRSIRLGVDEKKDRPKQDRPWSIARNVGIVQSRDAARGGSVKTSSIVPARGPSGGVTSPASAIRADGGRIRPATRA